MAEPARPSFLQDFLMGMIDPTYPFRQYVAPRVGQWLSDRFGGPRVPQGAPLPSWMNYPNQGPSQYNPYGNWSDPSGNPTAPRFPWEQQSDYNDAMNMGPPEWMAGNNPFGGYNPRPRFSGPGSGGGSFSPSAQTVLTGDAAVDFARGLYWSGAGLNAHGRGMDALRRQVK